MSGVKTVSIKEYLVKYTVIIFMVIFAASLLHYFVYSQYLHRIQEKEYQKTLIQAANSVSHTLNFYQAVVDELASLHTVIDLLQFGNNEETQQWANSMQRLLPDSIGLTLFDSNGNVKGEFSELRLSDKCIADMKSRFDNKVVAGPPVHHRIEALAHYDIASSIIIDGEKIGQVFASFSLDTVKRLLTDFYNDNQAIDVIAADGYLIASVGNVDTGDENVEVYKHVINGTNWVIELKRLDVEENMLVTSLFISNMIVFLLLSFTLYIAIKQLFKVVISDFEILSWLMQKIKEGIYKSEDVPQVSLKEAQSIVHFIKYTAEELHAYQTELKVDSLTDELTGLNNRRALNAELEKCLLMADKGQHVYAVILDLDNFKIINDTYGHDVGDAVLIFLSEAMRKASRSDDICVRAGGDEFIVILMNYEMQEVKNWYLELMKISTSSVRQYNEENKTELKLGVSAGATFIRNSDRISTVLKRADNALYKVKEDGRNKIEFL